MVSNAQRASLASARFSSGATNGEREVMVAAMMQICTNRYRQVCVSVCGGGGCSLWRRAGSHGGSDDAICKGVWREGGRKGGGVSAWHTWHKYIVSMNAGLRGEIGGNEDTTQLRTPRTGQWMTALGTLYAAHYGT